MPIARVRHQPTEEDLSPQVKMLEDRLEELGLLNRLHEATEHLTKEVAEKKRQLALFLVQTEDAKNNLATVQADYDERIVISHAELTARTAAEKQAIAETSKQAMAQIQAGRDQLEADHYLLEKEKLELQRIRDQLAQDEKAQQIELEGLSRSRVKLQELLHEYGIKEQEINAARDTLHIGQKALEKARTEVSAKQAETFNAIAELKTLEQRVLVQCEQASEVSRKADQDKKTAAIERRAADESITIMAQKYRELEKKQQSLDEQEGRLDSKRRELTDIENRQLAREEKLLGLEVKLRNDQLRLETLQETLRQRIAENAKRNQ